MARLSWLVLLLTLFVGNSTLHAGWYARPYAGYAVNLDESESNFSLGAGVGYEFLDHLVATEVGYSRIFSDPDTDLIEATVRVGVPIIPVYGIAGAGLYQTDVINSDWESSYRLGAGFYLPFIPLVKIGGELTYLNLGGDTHLLSPVITVGLSL